MIFVNIYDIGICCREKSTLQDQVTKLQYELAQLKERNSDTSHKIKRSLDVVEQAQFEKTQLEAEIRRLKDELDRQHDKLRETIHEQVFIIYSSNSIPNLDLF